MLLESIPSALVFETGLTEEKALDTALWLGRQKPNVPKLDQRKMTRRQIDEQYAQEQRDKKEKERIENERPSLEALKVILLDVEQAYTEWATALSREWELKYVRDLAKDQIRKADNVQDLSEAVLKLDRGFSHPFELRLLKNNNNLDESKIEEEENESDSSS